MKNIIKEFFECVATEEIEIYNEFSLQHELGMFLRNHKSYSGKKIQFERNVSYFGLDKSKYEKKEIDLVIFSEEDKRDSTVELDTVIELKYPRNGQVPESMFSFCKDISFLEQLSDSGFKSAYFLVVVDDPLFYSGNNKGIYALFRNAQLITGIIQKPTGNKGKSITIKGSYQAIWQNVLEGTEQNKLEKTKYCLIEVSG